MSDVIVRLLGDVTNAVTRSDAFGAFIAVCYNAASMVEMGLESSMATDWRTDKLIAIPNNVKQFFTKYNPHCCVSNGDTHNVTRNGVTYDAAYMVQVAVACGSVDVVRVLLKHNAVCTDIIVIMFIVRGNNWHY